MKNFRTVENCKEIIDSCVAGALVRARNCGFSFDEEDIRAAALCGANCTLAFYNACEDDGDFDMFLEFMVEANISKFMQECCEDAAFAA